MASIIILAFKLSSMQADTCNKSGELEDLESDIEYLQETFSDFLAIVNEIHRISSKTVLEVEELSLGYREMP